MTEIDRRKPATSKLARIVSVASFVLAAVVVTVLLHKWRQEPVPGPDRAIAMLNGGSALPPGPPTGRGAAYAAKFDRDIATSVAPGSLVFRALKSQFPAEYQAYLRLYADRSGAGVPVARFRAETQAWVANFMTSHVQDLVRAPDALLLATVHAQTSAATALRATSPTLCAHYATTGFQPGDPSPPPQVLAALDQSNSARIMAMGQGRRHPARPEPITMAQTDAEAFANATMRLGATATDLDQMSSPGTINNMPAARQCDVSIMMLQAIANLPRDQAGRVASAIFQDPAKMQ